MIRKSNLLGGMLAAAFLVVAVGSLSASEEYIWVRSNGVNAPASYMTDGMGNYYVPKSLYGNNQKGQPVKNPGGLMVPEQQPKPMPSRHKSLWKRLFHQS